MSDVKAMMLVEPRRLAATRLPARSVSKGGWLAVEATVVEPLPAGPGLVGQHPQLHLEAVVAGGLAEMVRCARGPDEMEN